MDRIKKRLGVSIYCALALLFTFASGEAQAQYKLQRDVVIASGGSSSGTGLKLLAAGGQPHPIKPSSGSLYVMNPGFIKYTSVVATVTISGTIRDLDNTALSGVSVSFGNQGSATTDATGFYSKSVPSGWSGTVKPSKTNFDFVPRDRAYTSITADSVNQDYVGYPTNTNSPPAPPTDLAVIAFGTDFADLKWSDNSSKEDGFIIKRSNPLPILPLQQAGNLQAASILADTVFIEVGRVGPDTSEFTVRPLKQGRHYIFRVSAFNQFGESSFTQKTADTDEGPVAPTDLSAWTRSDSEILLSWKDNDDREEGFAIEWKFNSEDETSWRNLEIGGVRVKTPRNTRSYLVAGLTPNTTYDYRVLTSDFSDPSNKATATTDAFASIVKHTKGLEVDNQGGGAQGWSHFEILNFDQLFDGHLQVWTGEDIVYDGDDGDFTSLTGIALYDPADGPADEHTAAASGPEDPVVMEIIDQDIRIEQFTYQMDDQNWIVIEWTVVNNGSADRDVKLAFFLDADAGGNFTSNDDGEFDAANNLVYLVNQDRGTHVGMALISDPSYFENYQINYFFDSNTPDNSNVLRNGEPARLALFAGQNAEKLSAFADDLTMTLVSNLGSIAANGSKKVVYAIAVTPDFGQLQSGIENAKIFYTSSFPQTPAPPILSSPANGATNIPVSSTLLWQASTGAVSYNVQVATIADFSAQVVNATGVTGLSYDFADFTHNTMYYWRVRATNTSGTSDWSEMWSFTTEPGTAVELMNTQTPEEFRLNQNYPNPFNPVTNIAFDIPVATKVSITIFNSAGLRVETLLNERLPAGAYRIQWDASGMASGLYFYNLQSEKFVQTRKLILLK